MAEPLGVLIAGIVAKWSGSATLNGLPLSLGERRGGTSSNPPAGTHLPYAVLVDPQSDTAGYTCGSIKSEHDIRIRIYGETPESCKADADLVKAIFDSDALSLTLAEGDLINHRPATTRYGMNDKNIHFVDLDYFFRTRRGRVA